MLICLGIIIEVLEDVDWYGGPVQALWLVRRLMPYIRIGNWKVEKKALSLRTVKEAIFRV